MDSIQNLLEQLVLVITNDGRMITGELKGFDQLTNIILKNTRERLFSVEGSQIVELGCYLIRGDTVCIIGELDGEKDSSIQWELMNVDPLPGLIL